MSRLLDFCAALTLAAVVHAQAPECRPLPGSDGLWSRSGLRFILVGEMHGTTETPRNFRDLVCDAHSAKRPVIAGIERPSSEQKAIDAFMGAGDHAAAVRALLDEPGWNVLDGRSSQAMLSLLEELRVLKLKEDVAEVIAFDGVQSGDSPAQREQRMASILMAAANRLPDCLVLVLTGNLHASKKPVARFGSYSWMAMLLPPEETISLVATDQGGEAWTQMSEGYGPHPLRSTGGNQRGVILADVAARERGYDGALSTGSASTPSRPALSDAPAPPACSK